MKIVLSRSGQTTVGYDFNRIKQINIENSEGYLWIIGAEYPALRSPYTRRQSMRNFTLHEQNKILEIDVAYVDDSAISTADKDVYVHLARQHKLNPMTDLAGATTAGGTIGDTSIAVGSLSGTEVIYKDMLFTIALATGISSRLTYRITQDTTLVAGAGTIYFWPGFEATIANTAVVTFPSSTLTPELERVLCQLTAARCAMSKGIKYINTIAIGGGSTPDRYQNWAERMEARAIKKLKALEDPELRAYIPYSRF